MSIISKVLKFAFIFFICFSGFYKDSFSQDKSSKPNVLLVTIDTLRADRLSCYDESFVKTPNIDGLAAKGIIFTRAFAHNTLTLPSHANILLGTVPPYHGVHTNVNFVVEEKYITLAEHLKLNGYATAAFIGGATLDSRFGLDQGFDIYDDTFMAKGGPKFEEAERGAEEVIGAALSWIQSQKGPWFAWIHIFDPHYPYEPPPPFREQYAGRPYDGEVAFTDFALGRVFGILEEKRQEQNTLVVLTSDHGESLGEHGEKTRGFFAYNSTLWVPLIIYYPGIQSGVCEEAAAHVDIFPTVCDVIGVDKPPALQGISLQRSLQGESIPERLLYFESLDPYFNEGWAPLQGYISENIKYIHSPVPEIYDLGEDFNEKENLASQKDIDEFEKCLKTLLDQVSSAKAGTGRAKMSQDMLEKLSSLGYATYAMNDYKNSFGPEDDIKNKMPVYNSVQEAYSLKDKQGMEKTIDALEKITAHQSTIPAAYIYLSRLKRENHQVDLALKTLWTRMEKFPEHYELLREYVDALLTKEDYPAIVNTLTSREMPQMEQDASLYNKLGIAYFRMNHLDKALATFEKAAAIDDEYADIHFNMGSIYLSRFLIEKNFEAYKKAENKFLDVLSLDAEHADTFNSLGALYFGNGDLTKAIQSWEKAVHLKTDLGKTYYYLGLAYYSQKENGKAFSYLSLYKEKYYHMLTPDQKVYLDKMISLVR